MGAGVLNLINRQFGVQRIYHVQPCRVQCAFAPCTDERGIYYYYYYAYIVIYGITYGSGAPRSRMQHPAKLINNCIRTSAWNRVGSVFGPKAIFYREHCYRPPPLSFFRTPYFLFTVLIIHGTPAV